MNHDVISKEPKFGSPQGESWLHHEYPKAYAVQHTKTQERLCIAVATEGSKVFRKLSDALESPFFLLYVLVVPRGGSASGRYQSPELQRDDMEKLINHFGDFWDLDGRHSVWLRSIPESATLVYDRHNVLYAYGPIDKYRAVLERLSFCESRTVEIPMPHQHSYSPEMDVLERELVSLPDWYRTDLHHEDNQ
jgi:hypothetical protein